MEYAEMAKHELKAARARLENDLVDYAEMASFHFANTSAHISSHDVTPEENRLQRIRDAIAQIDELLAT